MSFSFKSRISVSAQFPFKVRYRRYGQLPNLKHLSVPAVPPVSVADPECLFWIPDPNFFYPRSRIRMFSIPDPDPRIQGSNRYRIPDPDPQHYLL